MSTENKYNDKAKQKVKELAEDIKVAMLATNLGNAPFNAIPMTTKKVDLEGHIWFLSPGDSNHNRDIVQDKHVQLLYSDPSGMKFLSVYGETEIVIKPSVLEELYDSFSDNWFSGVDDPNLTAIKFSPKEAYFWDSGSNKLVNLFKMGVGAVTGKSQEVGKKGKLDL